MSASQAIAPAEAPAKLEAFVDADTAAGFLGIARRGSAGRLAESLSHTVERRAVQYRLEHLEACGFILRVLPKKGSHEFYPILINNYVPMVGDDKGRVLRPVEIKACAWKWKNQRRRKIRESECGDDRASTQDQRATSATSAHSPRTVMESSALPQRNLMECSAHLDASKQDIQHSQDLQKIQNLQNDQEGQHHQENQDSTPQHTQKEAGPSATKELSGRKEIEDDDKDKVAEQIPARGRMQGQQDSPSVHQGATKQQLTPEQVELKKLEEVWRLAPEGSAERKAAAAAYCAAKKAQDAPKATDTTPGVTTVATAGGAD